MRIRVMAEKPEHTPLSEERRLPQHILHRRVQRQTCRIRDGLCERAQGGEVEVVGYGDAVPRGDFKDFVRAVAVESGPLDRRVRVAGAGAAPVEGGALAAVGDDEGAALVRDRKADN